MQPTEPSAKDGFDEETGEDDSEKLDGPDRDDAVVDVLEKLPIKANREPNPSTRSRSCWAATSWWPEGPTSSSTAHRRSGRSCALRPDVRERLLRAACGQHKFNGGGGGGKPEEEKNASGGGGSEQNS